MPLFRPNIEKLRDRGDVRGLAKILRPRVGSDAELQLAAAEALGEIGDDRAIEALMGAVLDWATYLQKGDVVALDPEVQTAAARALGAIGPHGVRPLVGALADPDPRVAAAAAQGLGEIGWQGHGVPETLARLQPQMAALVAEAKSSRTPGARDIALLVREQRTIEILELAHKKVAEALDRVRSAIPAGTDTAQSAGRRAYLVLLWDTKPWSSAEQEAIVAGKRAELGVDAELLKTVRVEGPMPTEPDTFVTATALLACEENGIEFDSGSDTISYKGGEHEPGVGLGLITIVVNEA